MNEKGLENNKNVRRKSQMASDGSGSKKRKNKNALGTFILSVY